MKFIQTLMILMAGSVMAQESPIPEDQAEIILKESLFVVERHLKTFESTSSQLLDISRAFCANEVSVLDFKEAVGQTHIAWAGVDMYQFGPIEQMSAALSVNFWPDKKSFVQKHIAQLEGISQEKLRLPETIRKVSVAVQGLPALRLVLEKGNCAALEGIAANIALTAKEIYAAWFAENGWAEVMRSAGDQNPIYSSRQESINELYHASIFGLERAKYQLEQPLGTNQTSFPNRVVGGELSVAKEAIIGEVSAVQELLMEGFGSKIYRPSLLWSEEQVKRIIRDVRRIESPLVEAVNNEVGRQQIMVVLRQIDKTLANFEQTVGPELGISTGFTASDGD